MIFVFGSNRLGIHGAGAAYTAHKEYGAVWGVGEGRTGDAYALPTKETPSKSLPHHKVINAGDKFLEYADAHPELLFLVTRVGCQRAGFADGQIAPIFRDAPMNCILPVQWQSHITPLPEHKTRQWHNEGRILVEVQS